jgi:phosphopantothenoylcysteine decarboxylase/phosphopantothenate--cysteine ligase
MMMSSTPSVETDGPRARRLLVCATGGYACYALPGFVLHLLRHFADDVRVVLSRSAATMVSTYAVEVAARNRVFVETSDHGDGIYVPHIELGRMADLVLVYPASVSILGKVANGIADELVSAIVLATPAPVVFVPIANPEMTGHPAVRRNVARLREDGYVVLPPLSGPEVATREGLDQLSEPFPLPTLLVQMRALVAGGSAAGVPRREQP